MKRITQIKYINKLSLIAVLLFAIAIFCLMTNQGLSPAHAKNSDIDVTVRVEPNGYVEAPNIGGVAPISGTVSGGTEITIIGNNLNAVTEVIVGSSAKCEPIIHIDDQHLSCKMPPHREGYVDITIQSAGGQNTYSRAFLYLSNIPSEPGTPGAPNTPGGPGGSTPLIPNTGLFRLGRNIVTLYDLLTLASLAIVMAVAFWLVIMFKRRKKTTNQSGTKTS